MNDSIDTIEGDPQFMGYTLHPIPDGCYRFGKSTAYCTKFSVYKKPHFIHRFFMKIIFGVYWEDNKSK